ncbi:MAG: winged helix-turn-helix domain-containing protein [Myxococcota bacterium]|jgi:DNA-binding response OmpR family regulator|nr:winged helix-turn-helix domain-containing protein [Myxococcota bacterium]
MTLPSKRFSDRPIRVLLVGSLGQAMREFLKASLEPQGMVVEVESESLEAIGPGAETEFDCVLASADPVTLGELFVHGSTRVPVIAVSEEANRGGRLRALESGAQECLEAPFGISELVGRILALISSDPGSGLTREDAAWPKDFEYARELRLVDRSDRSVSLTRGEDAILNCLLSSPGQVLGASDLALRLWGPEGERNTARVEGLVANLRRKLDRGHPQRVIEVVGAEGYSLASARPLQSLGGLALGPTGAADPSPRR